MKNKNITESEVKLNESLIASMFFEQMAVPSGEQFQSLMMFTLTSLFEINLSTTQFKSLLKQAVWSAVSRLISCTLKLKVLLSRMMSIIFLMFFLSSLDEESHT